MPYAEDRETARRWATERAIDYWTWFCGDLSAEMLANLGEAATASRADGAVWVQVVQPGDAPSALEHALADEIVVGAPASEPWGLFAALQAAGADDVRRLGLLGASRAALDAAHHAGAGAIVGIAGIPYQRVPLLPS